jgi:uncharacterized protein YidB (DUF937 family)
MNPLLKTLTTEILSSMTQGAGSNALGVKSANSDGGALIQTVVSMFLKPSNTSMGASASGADGLQGLISQFQNSGLDDLVGSWIGTGPNKSISPDKILSALGQDQVAQFAQKTGLEQSAAATSLADIIPQLINQLSPQGKIDNSMVKNLLSAVL